MINKINNLQKFVFIILNKKLYKIDNIFEIEILKFLITSKINLSYVKFYC